MEELIDKLNALCDEQPFDTGWWLKDLRTGRTWDRNGDKIYYSASTRKIAIMMAALKGVNEGRFSLDQPVEVIEEYQRTNSSPFGRVAPGFSMTFQDFMVMMIILSDNTCTGTVVDMVGLDYINEFCASIGMVGTTHRQRTPPENLAVGPSRRRDQRDHCRGTSACCWTRSFRGLVTRTRRPGWASRRSFASSA